MGAADRVPGITLQECAMQGLNSKPAPYNQEVTTRNSQGDSQSASTPADTELKRVIDAWQKLPINLRSAIVAIVDLKCPIMESVGKQLEIQ